MEFKAYVEWDRISGYRISKYPGICKHCGQRYHAGEKVNWNPRVKGTCCHAGCYAKYGSPVVETSYTEHKALDVSKEYDETPKVVEETPTQAATDSLGSIIADKIAPYLENRLKGLVTEEQVSKIVNQILDGSVLKTVTSVDVTVWDKESFEIKDLGLQHKSFAKLLQALQARTSDGYRLNIWLTGPAGTGKTTAAKNCATALGLPFYFTGSIDTEYKLTGFIDAQGRVINTAFRTAYQNGGVFLFDECDSSLPAALLAFNAALANGEAAFPDAIVQRHKDFVCIAAANTWGLGATNDYVGRLKLDAAFLDRFAQIFWDVDEGLELATCGNADWCRKVQQYRGRAKSKGIKVIISPRASYYGAALLATGMDESTVLELTVRKAMTEEQWSSIKW